MQPSKQTLKVPTGAANEKLAAASLTLQTPASRARSQTAWMAQNAACTLTRDARRQTTRPVPTGLKRQAPFRNLLNLTLRQPHALRQHGSEDSPVLLMCRRRST